MVKREEFEKLPGWPSEKRFKKGPVAVIECPQEIPCNPCEGACKNGAIHVGKNVINLPKLSDELCNGCGICIAACPGLAIFVVDLSYSKKQATIMLPYEYTPIPKKDEIVNSNDRNGRFVCKGSVVKVRKSKRFDKTVIVTVAVPKKYVHEVRAITALQP